MFPFIPIFALWAKEFCLISRTRRSRVWRSRSKKRFLFPGLALFQPSLPLMARLETRPTAGWVGRDSIPAKIAVGTPLRSAGECLRYKKCFPSSQSSPCRRRSLHVQSLRSGWKPSPKASLAWPITMNACGSISLTMAFSMLISARDSTQYSRVRGWPV